MEHVHEASTDNCNTWKSMDELTEQEVNDLFEQCADGGAETAYECECYSMENAKDETETEGRRAYLYKLSEFQEVAIG